MSGSERMIAVAWLAVCFGPSLGCGAAHVTTPKHAAHVATPKPELAAAPALFQPSALYRDLFSSGKTWRYEVTEKCHFYAPNDERAVKGTVTLSRTFMISCRVLRVHFSPSAAQSEISCDEAPPTEIFEEECADPSAEPEASGSWVADQSGLVQLPRFMTDEKEIQKLSRDPVIAAVPTKYEETDDDGDDGDGSLTSLNQVDGEWCLRNASWSADRTGSYLCFSHSTISSYGTWFEGGWLLESDARIIAK